MNRNNSKNLAAPREDNADDLLSMTDTEDSSSSSKSQVFENQALILELHELQRDELPDNPLPEVKTRKLSKKRPKPGKKQRSEASLTSSSESSVATPVAPEQPTEEFFDAQGSYVRLSASPQDSSSAKVHSVPETTQLIEAATTASIQQANSAQPAPQPTAIAKPTEPINPDNELQ